MYEFSNDKVSLNFKILLQSKEKEIYSEKLEVKTSLDGVTVKKIPLHLLDYKNEVLMLCIGDDIFQYDYNITFIEVNTLLENIE